MASPEMTAAAEGETTTTLPDGGEGESSDSEPLTSCRVGEVTAAALPNWAEANLEVQEPALVAKLESFLVAKLWGYLPHVDSPFPKMVKDQVEMIAGQPPDPDPIPEVDPLAPDEEAPVVDQEDIGEAEIPLAVSPNQVQDTGVTFYAAYGPTATSIVGMTSTTGGVLAYGFDHWFACPSVRSLEFDVNEHGATLFAHTDTAEFSLLQLSPPWAVDGEGRDLPTWYEAQGSVLSQVVDATDAVAPVVFDPTYYTLNCHYYHPQQIAQWYLGINSTTNYCPPLALVSAAKGYRPVDGYQASVYNDYGLIVVKQSGECNFQSDTHWAYDRQIPCKAHDYCYDLRRASLSATVTDKACDDMFYHLMEADCNDQRFATDCRNSRNSWYYAVRNTSANPEPGLIRIKNYRNGKCADLEGPSWSYGAPIQQWQCVNVANQKWRVYPANGAKGYFEFRVEHSKLCADTDTMTSYPKKLSQWPCGTTGSQRHFTFRAPGGGWARSEVYSLRSRHSNKNACWDVPHGYTNDGLDWVEWHCDGTGKQQFILSKA